MHSMYLAVLAVCAFITFVSGAVLRVPEIPTNSLDCQFLRKIDGGSTLGVWPKENITAYESPDFIFEEGLDNGPHSTGRIIERNTGLLLVYAADSEAVANRYSPDQPNGLILVPQEAMIDAPMWFNVDKWSFTHYPVMGWALTLDNGTFSDGSIFSAGTWLATPGFCGESDHGSKECDGWSLTACPKGQKCRAQEHKESVYISWVDRDNDRCESWPIIPDNS